MAIISQLTPVSELLNSVGGVVNAWRKPTLKSADFASVLREKMQHSNDPSVLRVRAENMRNAVDRSAGRFIDLRDANNDQLLSKDETAMNEQLFAKLDANGDGLLSRDELKKPGLDAIARLYPESTLNA